jgi:dCTP deaminase
MLNEFVELKYITNVKSEYVNSSSIDVTIGNTVLVEATSNKTRIISLSNREPIKTYEEKIDNGFLLHPGQFILAHTQQLFNLPNWLSAEYKLKSSMARIGLEHLNAGWCDAGWNGSVLTLELRNMTKNHIIELKTGDRIGQMIFWQHEPVSDNASYATRGRYNKDLSVSGIKL